MPPDGFVTVMFVLTSGILAFDVDRTPTVWHAFSGLTIPFSGIKLPGLRRIRRNLVTSSPQTRISLLSDAMGLYPVTISSPIPPPPQPFSNRGPSPNIFGLLDGINTVFYTGVNVQKARVYLNGLFLMPTLDFSFYGDTVVFAANRVPQPGDTLLILGWL